MTLRSKDGFGAIEIIVAATLISILSLAGSSMIRSLNHGQSIVSRKSQAFDMENQLRSQLFGEEFCNCNFGKDSGHPMTIDPSSLLTSIPVNPEEELFSFGSHCQRGSLLVRKNRPLDSGLTPESVTLTDLSAISPTLLTGTLKIAFRETSGSPPTKPVRLHGLMLRLEGSTVQSCLLQPVVPFSRSVTFSEPGIHAWAVPSGVTTILVEAWGGGGGGGGARWWQAPSGTACGGGGGGAGGYFKSYLSVTSGESFRVEVGSGGLGGSAGTDTENGSPALSGGDSSIGLDRTIVVAEGGEAGQPCIEEENHNQKTGFGRYGGCHTASSCGCESCISHHFIEGGAGGNGQYNYNSSTMALGGNGGNAPNGGQGGPHNPSPQRNDFPGTSPGGGGGGGTKYNDPAQARPGASGGNGRVIISW